MAGLLCCRPIHWLSGIALGSPRRGKVPDPFSCVHSDCDSAYGGPPSTFAQGNESVARIQWASGSQPRPFSRRGLPRVSDLVDTTDAGCGCDEGAIFPIPQSIGTPLLAVVRLLHDLHVPRGTHKQACVA